MKLKTTLHMIGLYFRFDIIWFSKLMFEDYNNEYFYASHWNDNGPRGLGPYDRQTCAGSGLLDFWFFSILII